MKSAFHDVVDEFEILLNKSIQTTEKALVR
jgi:hypothetical protein